MKFEKQMVFQFLVFSCNCMYSAYFKDARTSRTNILILSEFRDIEVCEISTSRYNKNLQKIIHIRDVKSIYFA